jgi:hypothetical protein
MARKIATLSGKNQSIINLNSVKGKSLSAAEAVERVIE